jgi:hypothetical protein
MLGGRSNSDALQKRLEALQGSDPTRTLRRLLRMLRDALARETNTRSRLKVLEMVLDRAEPEISTVEIALDRATLPLSSALQQGARAANHLLKALGLGYADTAAQVSGRWRKLRYGAALRASVIRAMTLEARRLRLAYRCYSRGSRRAWTQLHHLNAVASKEGFLTAAGHDKLSTPRRIYVDALLLALAQPNTFAAGQLHRARAYIGQFGHLVTLESATTMPTSQVARFIVRPGEGRPATALSRLRPPVLQPGDLLLDCVRLVRKTQTQMAGLRTRVSPAKLGLSPEIERVDTLALLHKLNVKWNAGQARRHHRINLNPRVDVVAGFDRLWNFLAGPAFRRRSEDTPDAAPLMDGHSEWTVLNLSPEGLSLRYISGDAAGVRVGELVGVRQRDRRALDVCVARQALNVDVNQFLLGLEGLGPQALPVTIEWGDRWNRYVVRAIMVPRMPRYRGACGLMAPFGALHTAGEVRVRDASHTLTMRVDRRLERTSSCELFTLIPTAAQSH